MSRSVYVKILKLTQGEYKKVKKIIDNANKALERSRLRSEAKKKELNEANPDRKTREVLYKKKPINLDLLVSEGCIMKKLKLKREREDFNSASDSIESKESNKEDFSEKSEEDDAVIEGALI